MNSLSSNTVFSSKMVRGFLASQGKIYVATCSPVRGHAHEAALKFGRIAYFFGSASGMVPGFARKFSIPYESSARGFHAFIKSFPNEIDAMRALSRVFPTASVMIDTYDLRKGLQNAIQVAQEQQKNKLPIFSAVFIDSGKNVKDYANQARYVRKQLDLAGLKQIKITVAGNFEEYKIKKLVDLKAPVDKVILGTEFIAPADDPKIEVVLKMAQFISNGQISQTAKLAKGKVSYPGLKQVYRQYKKGKMIMDVIALEDENFGEPLLIKILEKGKSVYKLPTLDQIGEYLKKQLSSLPESLRRIDKEYVYKVSVSERLEKLLDEIRINHSQ